MSASVVAPGQLVAARYRLEGGLGTSGAQGTAGPHSLWRAFDTVLARPVAVRLLDRADARAPALLEAARRAAGVNSPFLARVYDAGEDGDHIYVVTELLDGGSLEELLRAGPLNADRASAIIADVGRGVVVAHKAGLPHLALSPRRVLFTSTGAPRLVGLGIAAALFGVDSVPALDALEAQSSPPRSDVPARTDSHGLGMLLYSALTARWPGRPDQSTLPAAPWSEGRLLSPGQVRAGIPRGLDGIVNGALPEHTRTWPTASTEPLRSPQDFVQALVELDQHGRGSHVPLVSVPPSANNPPERSGTLKQVLRIVVPLAVVAAVIAAVWLSSQQIHSASLPDHQPGTSTTHAQAPGTDAATIPIVAVRDFDPDGDGTENPQQVPLSHDGKAQTAWTTQTYRTAALGNLKPGVGLVIDLGQPTAVASVTVQLVGDDTTIELRAGSTDPTTEQSMTIVASATDASGSVVLTPRTPTKERYWLLWLTKLPQIGPNNYRGSIAEMVFHR